MTSEQLRKLIKQADDLLKRGERALGSAKEYASFLAKPYADTDIEHLLRSVLPKAQTRALQVRAIRH